MVCVSDQRTSLPYEIARMSRTQFKFERLKRVTSAHGIVEQFRIRLLSGNLGAGDRIGSERELSDQFNVSRTVLREALAALSALGVLDIRAGVGTVVSSDSSSIYATPMRWARTIATDEYGDVIEARRIIEVESAALAALRAEPEQVERLQALVESTREPPITTAALVALEKTFHGLIGEMTGNKLLASQCAALIENYMRLWVEVFGDSYPTPMFLQAYPTNFEEHLRLSDSIASGNETEAHDAMEAHLDRAMAIVLASYERGAEIARTISVPASGANRQPSREQTTIIR